MTEGNFKRLKKTIEELRKFKRVLLLTCSNRGEEVMKTQKPKSSITFGLVSALTTCSQIFSNSLSVITFSFIFFIYTTIYEIYFK